ncbi:MAG: LPS translocon maturation chaperone LptM [Parashewanella sp.]
MKQVTLLLASLLLLSACGQKSALYHADPAETNKKVQQDKKSQPQTVQAQSEQSTTKTKGH